jgi:2-polyprenyl-3-methyl-5-hydroxy-6-metoxy-1,4-benzoquinol methylase
MQEVWTEIDSLRSELASQRRAKDTSGTAQSLAAIRTSLMTFQDQTRKHIEDLATAVERAVAEHTTRTAALQADMGTLRGSLAPFEEQTAGHLQRLTTELNRTANETSVLLQRLYAKPYMADPPRFSYPKPDGQPVLGFVGRRQSCAAEYVGFEDVFRGPESLIQDRFRRYLPLLERHKQVLDIGCGRGELLDVLAGSGLAARGVDSDPAMVERCRRKGHIVELMDGGAYLRGQADASLPVIFAAQVVEHLPYDQFLEFLELSRCKLKPGGQLIFETVNPHSLEAFKTFYTDLTHQRPIFPEVAVALCWLKQFDEAYVFYPNGIGDEAQDRVSQGEYAVVATKAISD